MVTLWKAIVIIHSYIKQGVTLSNKSVPLFWSETRQENKKNEEIRVTKVPVEICRAQEQINNGKIPLYQNNLFLILFFIWHHPLQIQIINNYDINRPNISYKGG